MSLGWEQCVHVISSSSRLCCFCCLVTRSCPTLLQPHGLQPARLLFPGDFSGKNTGVGCHFLLQCMKVKSESEIAQLCLTLGDPRDFSLPGSSIHGIFHARVLEWVAIVFSHLMPMGPQNNIAILEGPPLKFCERQPNAARCIYNVQR